MQIQMLEERTGLDRATIRYYEKEGLITPNRLNNGYRDYSENDLNELLKIKLLRMLKVPLEQIIDIKQGRKQIGDVLNRQIGLLGSEQEMLLRASQICKVLCSSGHTYGSLDPKPYLAMFEEGVSQPASGKFKPPLERIPEEPHPVRRYLARWIDLNVYSIVLAVIFHFALNIRPFMDWHNTLLSITAIVVTIPINAFFLSLTGTTLGKRIAGITLTREDGTKLSFQDAARREWNVIRYGYGYHLPIYSIWILYKNYKACKAGEWLDWEEHNCEPEYEPWTGKKEIISIITIIFFLVLSVIIAFFAYFPPNNPGNITLEEFAENYNRIAIQNELSTRMDPNGQLYEDLPQNSIVIDLDEGDHTFELNYETEENRLKQISYLGSWKDFGFISCIPYKCDILTVSSSMLDNLRYSPKATILDAVGNGIFSGEIIMDHITIRWEVELIGCQFSYPNYIISQDSKNELYSLEYIIVFH